MTTADDIFDSALEDVFSALGVSATFDPVNETSSLSCTVWIHRAEEKPDAPLGYRISSAVEQLILEVLYSELSQVPAVGDRFLVGDKIYIVEGAAPGEYTGEIREDNDRVLKVIITPYEPLS